LIVATDHVSVRGRRPAHPIAGRPAVDEDAGSVPHRLSAGRVGADEVAGDDDPGRPGSGEVEGGVTGRVSDFPEAVENEAAGGTAGTPRSEGKTVPPVDVRASEPPDFDHGGTHV